MQGDCLEEVFVNIQGYEGRYMVSNLGNILSLPNRLRNTSKLLKPLKQKYGHLQVNLSNSGVICKKYIHILVASHFVDGYKSGLFCCHKDGNPSNNIFTNLKWGTPLDNSLDRIAHGRSGKGEKHPQAKLTDICVIDIKNRLLEKQSKASIARLYNVSESTIRFIANGKKWGHL